MPMPSRSISSAPSARQRWPGCLHRASAGRRHRRLLADPAGRFADLGPDYHQRRTDKDLKIRNHIRQLEALGYTVTITQAA